MTRILTVLLIGLALLAGGCNDDEISSLPEASGPPPMHINTIGGGSFLMTGTWGGCEPDGSNSHKTTITFNGGRADVVDQDFIGNINCLPPANSINAYTVTFRNEGSVSVLWVSPPGPPSWGGGTPPNPISATRVLVNFQDGNSSKGLSVIDAFPAAPFWYPTWDDPGKPLDSAGYPTEISSTSIWGKVP